MQFNYLRIVLLVIFVGTFYSCGTQQKLADNKNKPFTVIAYYLGNGSQLDKLSVEKLTHIIYSFCHLKGNRLNVDNAADTVTIRNLVLLKLRNPSLKVMLSLGGWGGCRTCSDVFSTDANRKEFAASVKELNDYFKTDGIDLDWEYPSIEGHPGHPYKKEDQPNFTALIKDLRTALGKKNEISFAAGGFDTFLEQAVNWKDVIPVVDRVNLMSYDLVSGFSTVTGHHTPLYSTTSQKQSAHNAMQYFESIGVPLNKIVIGAAFYGRSWENVENINNGLYQSGKFKSFISYNRFDRLVNKDSGYVFFRDPVAQASYAYNADKKIYVTFDDSLSIHLKTKYALEKKLNGIMFWEITLDKQKDGLLDVIDKAVRAN